MITKKTLFTIIILGFLLFVFLTLFIYFRKGYVILFLINMGTNFYLGMASISATLTGFALIAVPLISNMISYDNPITRALRENLQLLRDIYGVLWLTSLIFLANLLAAIIILVTGNVTNVTLFNAYLFIASLGIVSFSLSIIGIWRLNLYILTFSEQRR